MWGREIKVWVSSVPLFWSLTWRQSEQGELGGTEKIASLQGSHSALQVLSGGVLWGLCVYMCVCGFVYLCVCVCVQEGTSLEREERDRQAQRAARMRVSRWEHAGEVWLRGGMRKKSCSFL